MDAITSLFNNAGFTGILGAFVGALGAILISQIISRQTMQIKRLEVESLADLKKLEMGASERRLIYESAMMEHKDRRDRARQGQSALANSGDDSPVFLSVLLHERIYGLLRGGQPESKKLAAIQKAVEEQRAIVELLRTKGLTPSHDA